MELRCSCNRCHSYSNSRFLTHSTTQELLSYISKLVPFTHFNLVFVFLLLFLNFYVLDETTFSDFLLEVLLFWYFCLITLPNILHWYKTELCYQWIGPKILSCLSVMHAQNRWRGWSGRRGCKASKTNKVTTRGTQTNTLKAEEGTGKLRTTLCYHFKKGDDCLSMLPITPPASPPLPLLLPPQQQPWECRWWPSPLEMGTSSQSTARPPWCTTQGCLKMERNLTPPGTEASPLNMC